MNATIRKPDLKAEFPTSERCWIREVWNDGSDGAVSIARARVAPGATTQLHRLRRVDERYLVVEGSGIVRIGTLAPEKVGPGNLVVIPARVAQQKSTDGNIDLTFYCICMPRFAPGCYEALE